MAEERLFVVDIKTLERVAIQFIPPEMTDSRTAKDGEIVIVGRNNPLNHYITGTDTVQFTFDFYAEEESREDVIRRVRWLKSLTMNNGYLAGRPKVKLVWGQLFTDEVWIVSSVTTSLKNFNPTRGYLPQYALADVTFKLDPDKNRTTRDVRK